MFGNKTNISFTLEITQKGTYHVKCNMPKGANPTYLSSLLNHLFNGNPQVIQSIVKGLDGESKKGGWQEQAEEIIWAIMEQQDRHNNENVRKPVIGPSDVLNNFRRGISPK